MRRLERRDACASVGCEKVIKRRLFVERCQLRTTTTSLQRSARRPRAPRPPTWTHTDHTHTHHHSVTARPVAAKRALLLIAVTICTQRQFDNLPISFTHPRSRHRCCCTSASASHRTSQYIGHHLYCSFVPDLRVSHTRCFQLTVVDQSTKDSSSSTHSKVDISPPHKIAVTLS